MPHPLFADDGRSRGSCYSNRCGGMAGPNSRPIRERRCVRANCPAAVAVRRAASGGRVRLLSVTAANTCT